MISLDFRIVICFAQVIIKALFVPDSCTVEYLCANHCVSGLYHRELVYDDEHGLSELDGKLDSGNYPHVTKTCTLYLHCIYHLMVTVPGFFIA